MLVGVALALGFWTLSTTARVGDEPRQPPVVVQQAGAPPRLVAVFIDSLAREIAVDARRMPALARLAQEGASFEVDPCRDQLTYLCLRAALTGHDESSLLAVADNFRPSHEGPPDSLLSALVATGRRSVVIGTEDLHPYRRYLHAERRLSKRDETEERVLTELHAARAEQAALVVVALGSGDVAAHAYGTGSAQYGAAFGRLDRVVGAVASSLLPDEHLLVFGDHGHDVEGRHLPGTASRTWALYRGPAFRAGVTGKLSLTDHRALLGTLLGVPTEPSYTGPALATIFAPSWVERHLPQGLPKLAAPARGAGRVLVGAGSAAAFVALVAAALGVGLRRAVPSRRLAGLGLVGVGLAALVGLRFDFLRSVVHDHGGEPQRGAWLLVPLSLAVAISRWHRRPWLALAAWAVLVCLLLLPPTAYYYGARRAIVLGGLLALGAVLVEWLRRAPNDRLWPAFALTFVAATLLTFYPVRQLGPETAGSSAWALDSALYTRTPSTALLLAKLVLAAVCIGPRVARHPLDSAVAALLLALCSLLQLTAIELPRAAYALLLTSLVLGVLVWRERVAGSLLAMALLLQVHLFNGDRARLAALELLLAAAAAARWSWPRLGLSGQGRSLATGLSAAVASYLMLWPTVGFHLVGIDFSYVFRWIPAEDYEQAWLLIALGVVAKLSLPLALLVALSRPRLGRQLAARALLATLSTKLVFLCVMIVSYAAVTDMRSQQALAMLAELCLVMFVSCIALVALPLWLRARHAPSAALAPATEP